MTPSLHHDPQDWWVPVLRALFLLAGGAVMLYPGLSDDAVTLIFAAIIMMCGAVVAQDAGAFRAPLLVVEGMLIFAIGVVTLATIDVRSNVMIITCAIAWALISGAFDLAVARRHTLLRGRGYLELAGIITLVGAVLIGIGAASSPQSWRFSVASTALANGLALLAFGLARRHRRGRTSAVNASIRDARTEVPSDLPPDFLGTRKV